jgi:hypothetical protein
MRLHDPYPIEADMIGSEYRDVRRILGDIIEP